MKVNKDNNNQILLGLVLIAEFINLMMLIYILLMIGNFYE